MDTWLLEHEPLVRLAASAGVLAAMLAWELAAPLRPALAPRRRRWVTNFALAVLDAALLRLAFPLLAVGAAQAAAAHGFGALNALAAPGWLAFAASLIALDLAIYAQHRVSHRWPLLWRLHRVHHSDPEVDASTALRFHPLEIALSMLYKLVLVTLLGAPASAVIAFEFVLNACALFDHGNVRLPPRLEAVLRWVLVTPELHRIHHSIHRDETDSNYGFSVVWWDRLFGTWRAAPREGQARMALGLDAFRTPAEQTLGQLLLQPLRETRR